MMINSFFFCAKITTVTVLLLFPSPHWWISPVPSPSQTGCASPQFQSIRFKEDISIFQEDWFPIQIFVDHEKSIYVLSAHSRKEWTFIEFDPQGKEISRRQIIKGQGPGEFQDFAPVFTRDGRVGVADWSQRRLTIMDKFFKIEKITKLNLYGDCFNMDSEGNMYFLAYRASKMRG